MEPFSYNLPSEVIAQRPVHPYHSAKLLVAERESGVIHDESFFEITKYLKKGDLLVLNNSRVIPARLLGSLASGGAVELLCVEKISPVIFRCLAKPMRKLQIGREILFDRGLRAVVLEHISECEIKVEFQSDSNTEELVRNVGIMPIPPYIRSGKSDSDDFVDYQTFFAKDEGSIAAPTAGLHFTPELIEKVQAHGCEVAFITLHVGKASFLPITSEDGKSLRLPGEEKYIFSKSVLDKISATRKRGGRVIVVGTTTVRALESMSQELERGIDIEESDGTLRSTEIFITPGYKYSFVDVLVTNFHQPRTTHLLLVEAFMGRDLLAKSYHHALDSHYRFLSYGDGMMII